MFIEKQLKYTIEYAIWLSSHWTSRCLYHDAQALYSDALILSWTCCMDGNQNFIYSFLNRRSMTATGRLLRSDSARLSRVVSSRKLIPTSRCMIASYGRANLCKLRGITRPDCIHNLFINSVLNLLTAESDEISIWPFDIRENLDWINRQWVEEYRESLVSLF